MDNQQESSTFHALSWLAGIIDGEGTITLSFHQRKNKTPIIKPVLTIVNTDELIINRIVEILKDNGFAFWMTSYEGKNNWKKRWVIEISGIKRLLRFLPNIKDLLVGKRERADLVYQWCLNRYDNTENKHRRVYYTKEDIDILTRIKKLQGHQDRINYSELLKSSETICGTSK